MGLVSELTRQVSTPGAAFNPAGLKTGSPLSQAIVLLVKSPLQGRQLVLSGFHPFLGRREVALSRAIRNRDAPIAVVGTERHLVHFAEAMLLAGPATVIDGIGIRSMPTGRRVVNAAHGELRLSGIRRAHQKELARIALSFDP